MKIPVTSILVPPRERDPDSELKLLRADIVKNGLKHPILVTKDQLSGAYALIDGLRRLIIIRDRGWPEVEVEVAESYEQACAYLEKTHDSPPSPHRILEIYSILRGLMYQRLGSRERGAKMLSSRALLLRALHMPEKEQSILAALIQLHRGARIGNDPWAKRLLTDVIDGRISVHGARQKYTKSRLTGDIVKVAEQRQLMNTAIATLNGIIKGLDSLGLWDSQISTTERESWAKDLSAQRTVISKVIRSLTIPQSTSPERAEHE